MEFTFTTAYNQKAMTAMARALRKTVRKKHSRRSHILGCIVVVLGLMFSLPFGNENFSVSFSTIITWLAVVAVTVVLIKEDAINGYFARKRALPQLLTSTTVFTTDGYHSSTEVGNSDFRYDNIVALAETRDYFVFIFSKSHAQVYEKDGLSGGTLDGFKHFVGNITGLNWQNIS